MDIGLDRAAGMQDGDIVSNDTNPWNISKRFRVGREKFWRLKLSGH